MPGEGNMWDWLNKNAGAVQALGAGATTLLTVLLAIITLWYVRLTRRLAQISRLQYGATVRPKLKIAITSPDPGPRYTIDYIIENIGEHPVNIWNIVFTVWFTMDHTQVYRSRHCFYRRGSPQILLEGDKIDDIVDLTEYATKKPPWLKRTHRAVNQHTELHVDCSDLAHSAQYCFVASTKGGCYLMPYFFDQPSKHGLVFLVRKFWAWLRGYYRHGVWTVEGSIRKEVRVRIPPRLDRVDF